MRNKLLYCIYNDVYNLCLTQFSSPSATHNSCTLFPNTPTLNTVSELSKSFTNILPSVTLISAFKRVQVVSSSGLYLSFNSCTSSGASKQSKALLMLLRLKVSENDPASTNVIPQAFNAVAACSRDDPDPKLKPPTKMSPY